MIKTRLLALALSALLPGPTALKAQTNAALPQGLDNYITQVMKTFEVPGLCIAVVKDGKPILTKGYGTKKLGTTDHVNEHTLFPIASNSKAFTATMLAMLVEEKKLDWDKPVIDYLPWFRMSDAYVTSQLTVKDLLVHRSGIGAYAGDLLQFPPTDYSREEIVKKLKYIPLTNSFRNNYAYDNILYLAAGELIKQVTGNDWEDEVRLRILQPIGMTETLSRISQFERSANRSSSHARFDGAVKEVTGFLQYGISDLTNPAGGIASNATDMAKWMALQLDSGRAINSKVLFKPATTTTLWKGVTPMPVAQLPAYLKPAQMDYQSYALGFYTYNYRSERAIVHGGKLDGFVSRVFMIPSKNLGIAILTNQESGGAISAIINHICDHVMRVPAFDWVAGYKKAQDIGFENIRKTEQAAITQRNAASRPSLPLEQYAGSYKDAWYGTVTITKEGGHLVMNFTHSPGMTGDMEHWQYDSFIVRWRHREFKADAYVTFSLEPDGRIGQVRMKAISPVTDPSYDFHDLQLKPISTN